jgi:hypothetical protein
MRGREGTEKDRARDLPENTSGAEKKRKMQKRKEKF